MKHDFFADIDFARLLRREYKPPIIPDIQCNLKAVSPFVYKETPGRQYKMIDDLTYTEKNETLILRKMDSSSNL